MASSSNPLPVAPHQASRVRSGRCIARPDRSGRRAAPPWEMRRPRAATSSRHGGSTQAETLRPEASPRRRTWPAPPRGEHRRGCAASAGSETIQLVRKSSRRRPDAPRVPGRTIRARMVPAAKDAHARPGRRGRTAAALRCRRYRPAAERAEAGVAAVHAAAAEEVLHRRPSAGWARRRHGTASACGYRRPALPCSAGSG